MAPSQVDEGLSIDGTIQPDCEQVGREGVAAVVGEREDPHPGLGLGALAQDEGAGEGVDVLDAHAGPVRDHLAPGGRRAQGVRVGGGEDPEVLGLLVGQDDEPAGAARRRA